MKKKLHYFAILFALFSPSFLSAQLTLNLTSQTERIDFDSSKANVNEDVYAGAGISSSPSSGELDADAWQIIGMSTGIFNFGDSAGTGDFGRGSSIRGVATGGLYAFSSANDGKFLGFQPGGSDMTPGSITLKINNNTGTQLDSLRISYTFYSYSDQTRSSELNPSYSLDNVTYTAMPALNDTSEQAINTVALAVAKQKDTTLAITIMNGGDFYLRWETDDFAGSGSRDELGIDNIEITGINASQALSVSSIATENVSCNGLSDGSAKVLANGGVMPFTYQWSNGMMTDSISNLSAGKYIVTVTDLLGDMAIDSVTITEPDSLVITLIDSDVACAGGNTGFINSMVMGGKGNYSYLWNTGDTTPNIDSLTVGIYTLTVVDSTGCFESKSDTIQQNPFIFTTFIDTAVNCNGGNDGSVQARFSGGAGSFSYSWSTGDTGTADSSIITMLAAGTYVVTVTDALLCTEVDSITITEPDSIDINLIVTNATNSSSSDGSISASVTGGQAPYTFLWNDPSSQTSSTATNLPVGAYCVTVTDNDGCFNVACDSVRDATVVGLENLDANENRLKLYPNPTTGFITIELENNNLIEERLQIYNVQGRLMRNEFITTNKLIVDLNDFENGVYFIQLGPVKRRIVISK